MVQKYKDCVRGTRLTVVPRYMLAIVLASLPCHPLGAVQRINLQFERLSASGADVQHVELKVNLGTAAVTAHLTAKQAQLTGVAEPLRDLTVDCSDVELSAARFGCAAARINGGFPYLGKQQLHANVSYARSSGAISAQLRNVKVAKGDAALVMQLRDAQWQATGDFKQADATELLKLAQRFLPTLGQGWSAAGIVNANLTAQGSAAAPSKLEWQLQADKLSVGNPDGTLASDALRVESTGTASLVQNTWQFSTQLRLPAGQAYAEPVFIDTGKYPITAKLTGAYLSDGVVQLDRLEVSQQDVVQATASGRVATNGENLVPELKLDIVQLQFPGAFDTYVQPFLLKTVFKTMRTAGTAQGTMVIKNTWPSQVDLSLRDIRTDDGNKSLVFNGINGDFHWRDAVSDETTGESVNVMPSRLSWQSGTLLGLELGATQMQLELWGTNVRIAEPTRIPIFNGALAIEAFRIRRAATPQMAFMLDATIEPINVAQLCRAFGWPEFGGELSGRLNKLRLEQDTLTLGATLTAQVFAGDVAINNMRLEGALSNWPRFNADLKLDNLDLEQVTQAFSFGRITGRLSGEINKLSLFNWEPVAMDANLFTPSNDHSKHRISQRAVQNIGSLGGSGGGVAAALQGGVLRFFEDFNYDKLGISCRLENNVCVMNGVAPAANGGYYLVKGSGIPRIDVIGNSTRVDWPRLLAQLKAATQAGAPVVK